MSNGPYIAEIAALVGDPTRANMLSALMDGGALSAGDLAFAAHVTASTASGHLARLVEARLLAGEKQGRRRYFRLASAEVARMLEEIMSVAVTRTRHYRPAWMSDEALRSARTCYDHLAGRLGVALAASLADRRYVRQIGAGPRGCRRQAPPLLPALRRLERAPPPPRRCGRSGLGRALLCPRLGRAGQRQPRGRDHHPWA
jgi:DNA-binding transcriptional ArsR family regulator